MKREVMIPICLVILCVFLYGGSPKKQAESSEYKDIPVRVVEPVYPEEYNNIDEITKAADRIFYGVVTVRKKAYYRNASDAKTGKDMKMLYTPINFKIEQMVKGAFVKNDESYYYEMGGNNGVETLDVRGLTPMRPDDAVVIFSRSDGTGWGNYSVFHVVGGKVTVDDARLPAEYAANDETKKTTFKVEAFLEMIKACNDKF